MNMWSKLQKLMLLLLTKQNAHFIQSDDYLQNYGSFFWFAWSHQERWDAAVLAHWKARNYTDCQLPDCWSTKKKERHLNGWQSSCSGLRLKYFQIRNYIENCISKKLSSFKSANFNLIILFTPLQFQSWLWDKDKSSWECISQQQIKYFYQNHTHRNGRASDVHSIVRIWWLDVQLEDIV